MMDKEHQRRIGLYRLSVEMEALSKQGEKCFDLKAIAPEIIQKVERCRTIVNLLSLLKDARRGSRNAERAAESYTELYAAKDAVITAAESAGLDPTPLLEFLYPREHVQDATHAFTPEKTKRAGVFLSCLLARLHAAQMVVKRIAVLDESPTS